MSTAKERALEERDQLISRLHKLEDFIKTPKFAELDEECRSLLERQEEHMRRYYEVLVTRIECYM